MQKTLEGVLCLLATPFTRDYQLSEENLRREIDWLVEEAGVHGIMPGGSVGEFAHLSDEERKRIFAICIDRVKGDIVTVAGTSGGTTTQAIELTKYAQDLGYDGVFVVPPHYWECTEDEVYEHYKRLAEATDTQIVLYNAPIFCKFRMTPKFVAKLAEISDKIVALKHPVSDIVLLTQMNAEVSKRLNIITVERTLLPNLIMGGKGAAVGPHTSPMALEIYNTYKKGDLHKAWEIQNRVTLISPSPYPLGIWKAKVSIVTGIDVGPPRPPYKPATETERSEIKKKLREFGII